MVKELLPTLSFCIYRIEADILNREREKLMKKLIEVEMDGQAAGKQASELRDLIRKFRNVSLLLCLIFI